MSDIESTAVKTTGIWPPSERKMDLGSGEEEDKWQLLVLQCGKRRGEREHGFIGIYGGGGLLPGSASQKQWCPSSGLKVESKFFGRKRGKAIPGERSGRNKGMIRGKGHSSAYMGSSPLWSELVCGGDTEQTGRPPVMYINVVTVHTHGCISLPNFHL